MPLRLIGAGLPRTGTSSLREALRHLLNAPIYHMSEAFAHPQHAQTWVDAIEGKPPQWETFLAGYAAGVDAPFSNCWRDLAASYPDAPVLLSHRGDPELWYRSMEATVLPRTREMLARGVEDPMVPLFRVIFNGVFTDLDDRDQVIAGYERWLTDVREQVEPGRLVEWRPGDGWEPICHALGVPVPDRPFPHENSTAAYQARKQERTLKDQARGAPWRDVDRYFNDALVQEDQALVEARAVSREALLPEHEVAPNQGKLLSLLCLMVGATRVLEFGTLGGYSTIWFARAVGPDGQVTTLEMDARCAEVARANFRRSGVEDRVDLILGPAAESAQQLIDQGTEPFDVIFIDADKPNNPVYLAASLALSRRGTVIVADNVVREGAVTDPESSDPRVHGSRTLVELMGQDDRLAATALQTVGLKGWDGFAIAVVL